jgi:hypothetical protein
MQVSQVVTLGTWVCVCMFYIYIYTHTHIYIYIYIYIYKYQLYLLSNQFSCVYMCINIEKIGVKIRLTGV